MSLVPQPWLPRLTISRTCPLVTVFLCQIGIFNAVVRDTPNDNGGLTALEVWVLCNIVSVFLTFIAYVVLLAWIRLEPFTIVAPQRNRMEVTKALDVKERRMASLEIGLFLCVTVGTIIFAVTFFAFYLSDTA